MGNTSAYKVDGLLAQKVLSPTILSVGVIQLTTEMVPVKGNGVPAFPTTPVGSKTIVSFKSIIWSLIFKINVSLE